MALADIADVAAAVGRELSADEALKVPALLDEASDLIEGWIRCTPDPVPGPVRRVAARMVARVLAQSAAAGNLVGVDQTGMTAGPFSAQRTFRDGATSGAPWLENTDKVKLRQYRRGGGMTSVGMTGEIVGWRDDF